MSSVCDELKDIQHWHNYAPLDDKYYKYSSNVIYTCCKIDDLYYQMCNARMSLRFCFDFDEYSMMGEDETSILYSKKYFIENALLYYNFCVDYLWQVLWLYYDNSEKVDAIATNEYYQLSMKQCDFESLICGLTEINENKLVNVLKNFFSPKNKIYDKIRSKYNYVKHRASFYTPGLGMNDEETMIPIPMSITSGKDETYVVSYKLPMITREVVELNDMKNILIDFDKIFVDLCEYFFELLIPKDYFATGKVQLDVVYDYVKQHLQELEEYSKKHPSIKELTPCEVIIKKI